MSTIVSPSVAADDYLRVRQFSDLLCAPIGPEDATAQSMPEASPLKWHLAHTTWFFETFLLRRDDHYRSPFPEYEYLFNSYYNSVGKQFPRPQRGLVTRPTLDETYAYREYVDGRVADAIAAGLLERDPAAAAVLVLGLNHEQQHQELMLTDLKHLLSHNPLEPAYRADQFQPATPADRDQWLTFPAALYETGHIGDEFAYDNESPRHRVWLEEFQLAKHPVTCGEFLEFIAADGYSRPEFWLSEGWATVQRECWTAPLYWTQHGDDWSEFTLAGRQPVDPHRPVCHVSYFEADAFARWSGARLPTESQWEVAAAAQIPTGNFVDALLAADEPVHPAGGVRDEGPARRLFGDVWEWTASSYAAYPGYQPAPGALGEYNGKFMNGQYVLRGGAAITPVGHVRPTYRNFFPPHARWMFGGLRLAR
ncbi:MAG: ergothioneine biosynthesis protein EgtB [Planctomycetales bacterium]|nr:ergothioneine biosynthesis protein EgtB [Planctomycetales bacterium]